MIIAGLVLAGLAAVFHLYIWYLESFAWTAPRTRATFGTTPEQAEATRPLAFNQGFYNLFLALTVGIGVILILTGAPASGLALVFAGTASMAAAGLVLAASDRTKLRSAALQAAPPLLALVALVIGLILP